MTFRFGTVSTKSNGGEIFAFNGRTLPTKIKHSAIKMSEKEGLPIAAVAEAVLVSELAVSSPVTVRSESLSSSESDVRRGHRGRARRRNSNLRVLRAHSISPPVVRNRLVDHGSTMAFLWLLLIRLTLILQWLLR